MHISRELWEKSKCATNGTLFGWRNREGFGEFISISTRIEALLQIARQHKRGEQNTMGLGTILIIILVIALLGGFSGLGGGPFYGTGYYGGGGLGLVLLIIIILVVLGRI